MPALAFAVNRHNLNSIAALTGTLEVDARTRDLPLHFLWQDGRFGSRLRALASASDRLIVALSLATADLPRAATLMEWRKSC